MNKYLLSITVFASFLLALGSCTSPTSGNSESATSEETSTPEAPSIDDLLAKYVSVRLTTNADLSETQKQMIPLLVQAAQEMDKCFWYEAYGDKSELLKSIEDPNVKKFVKINYGPWDRLNGNAPFVEGVGAKPAGANFYPADMTKDEFEASGLEGKDNLYTFLRRNDNGDLESIPYHKQFEAEHMKAAELLIASR